MGKNLQPQCKQCRRAGVKLFLKGERCYSPKCEIVKRNYAPGVHGQKRRGRLSEYGLQLSEKQKAKKEYNLLEKQFRLTFEKAKKQGGNTGENLFRLLETRLDNTVYRMGLASSRRTARQMVSHGHILVNGKKVNIPSCQVKTGDIISVKEGKKKSKLYAPLPEKLKKAVVPGWLNLNAKELSAKVTSSPNSQDLKFDINAQMIVEFYSR